MAKRDVGLGPDFDSNLNPDPANGAPNNFVPWSAPRLPELRVPRRRGTAAQEKASPDVYYHDQPPSEYFNNIWNYARPMLGAAAREMGIPTNLRQAGEQYQRAWQQHPVTQAIRTALGPAEPLVEAGGRGLVRSAKELKQAAQDFVSPDPFGPSPNPAGAAVHALSAVPFLGPAMMRATEEAQNNGMVGSNWLNDERALLTNPRAVGTALGGAVNTGLMLGAGKGALDSIPPEVPGNIASRIFLGKPRYGNVTPVRPNPRIITSTPPLPPPTPRFEGQYGSWNEFPAPRGITEEPIAPTMGGGQEPFKAPTISAAERQAAEQAAAGRLQDLQNLPPFDLSRLRPRTPAEIARMHEQATPLPENVIPMGNDVLAPETPPIYKPGEAPPPTPIRNIFTDEEGSLGRLNLDKMREAMRLPSNLIQKFNRMPEEDFPTILQPGEPRMPREAPYPVASAAQQEQMRNNVQGFMTPQLRQRFNNPPVLKDELPFLPRPGETLSPTDIVDLEMARQNAQRLYTPEQVQKFNNPPAPGKLRTLFKGEEGAVKIPSRDTLTPDLAARIAAAQQGAKAFGRGGFSAQTEASSNEPAPVVPFGRTLLPQQEEELERMRENLQPLLSNEQLLRFNNPPTFKAPPVYGKAFQRAYTPETEK